MGARHSLDNRHQYRQQQGWPPPPNNNYHHPHHHPSQTPYYSPHAQHRPFQQQQQQQQQQHYSPPPPPLPQQQYQPYYTNGGTMTRNGARKAQSPQPNHHHHQQAKQSNFLARLFARPDIDALAHTAPAPVGGEMPAVSSTTSPTPPPTASSPQQNGGGVMNNNNNHQNHNHNNGASSSMSPNGNAELLRDRPAVRLDQRLVCKYEILSVVGKGSFSQVLRVQHRLSRQYFAVKLVAADCGAVNNELAILSRLSHPFVIRLEEVFKSASKLFIVMELASGGEMYDRVVAKGRYSESETRQALCMLLQGLVYLHGIGVCHRDLKPENLLYSDQRADARLLITDFGLAHQSTRSDETMNETCGTPEYIAPELLLRIPYTNKVDMWAVGVIAYILMSGIMPFDDDCRSRLYTHIITANYVYYPQFWSAGEAAKQFVDALLETNSSSRLSAHEALQHEWLRGEKRPPTVVAHANGTIPGSGVSVADSRRTHDYNSMQRTRSSRSIRSVTRSDHGHRVDPREVDRLAGDLQRAAQQQTKHYGVF